MIEAVAILRTGLSVCSGEDDVSLQNISFKMVQREFLESKSHNFIILTSCTTSTQHSGQSFYLLIAIVFYTSFSPQYHFLFFHISCYDGTEKERECERQNCALATVIPIHAFTGLQ